MEIYRLVYLVCNRCSLILCVVQSVVIVNNQSGSFLYSATTRPW